MKKLTAIVIGAGGRGMGYTRIMHDMEGKFELVGIVEPVKERVEYQWGDKLSEKIPLTSTGNDVISDHGGGDASLMTALYEYFTGTYTGNATSAAEISYLNHLISFGAEESIVTDKVIDIKEYSKNL